MIFLVQCANMESDSELPDSVPLSSNLEIIGTWTSNFRHYETGDIVMITITNKLFGSNRIIEYSNNSDLAITQNPSSDMFYPDQFNKERWIIDNANQFRLCTIAYNQSSAEEAKNASEATLDFNSDKGCNGFGFTIYTR